MFRSYISSQPKNTEPYTQKDSMGRGLRNYPNSAHHFRDKGKSSSGSYNLLLKKNHMQAKSQGNSIDFRGCRDQAIFSHSQKKLIMHGTCFPLPSFDINNHSPVLLSKVLQDDHIMGFIGIIHINTAGSHTEDLEHGRQGQKGDMETRKNSKA